MLGTIEVIPLPLCDFCQLLSVPAFIHIQLPASTLLLFYICSVFSTVTMENITFTLKMLLSPPSLAILFFGAAILLVCQFIARVLTRTTKRRDVEAPASPQLKTTINEKVPTTTSLQESPRPKNSPSELRRLKHYKNLYHKVQNLEQHPKILEAARTELIALLSSTTSTALQTKSTNILAIDTYSRSALETYLQNDNDTSTTAFEAYIARRRAGSPREMFSDRDEAKWWLKNAAPVKYVDGSWLGHINKITTPFPLRSITKDAWQVMSEELGDGDLAKNHVFVYEDLMREIGETDLPAGDSEDFIHPRHELDELRVWRAAVAQLLVSLFAHDFLPESLGFNMAYEGLPLHLMKTVEELRELKLNGYYFVLHISIDNADSGHSKMATEAVIKYIEYVRATTDSEEEVQKAWRRVQAGFMLAEGLPTTPEAPSLKKSAEETFPRNDLERRVVEVFAAKAPVAHKLHCSSKLKIGRQTLVDWLDPSIFSTSKQWQMDFLDDLADCKPWIKKGDADGSKLVQEMSWGGRMFGSFTEGEMIILKNWVNALPDERPSVYCNFTGRTEEEALTNNLHDITTDYPVLDQSVDANLQSLFSPSTNDTPTNTSPTHHTDPSPTLKPTNPNTSHHAHFGSAVDITRLVPLWFATPSLLESFVNVPAKVSNRLGSAVVRLLRAQTGFAEEGDGVAGMDEVVRGENGQVLGLVELGLEMLRRGGGSEGVEVMTLKEVLRDARNRGAEQEVQFAEVMLHASMRPMRFGDVLVGMTAAFVELHEHIVADAALDVLSEESRAVLAAIARRERASWEICREEIERDEDTGRLREYEVGLDVARRRIAVCFA